MMAKKLQKVFAILLSISMLASRLSFTAFAASAEDTQAKMQVEYAGGTNYYKADGSTGSENDHAVALSKNVYATGTENVFDIELKVDTSLDRSMIKRTVPDAAVVLTIDISGTMVSGKDMKHLGSSNVQRLAVAKYRAKEFLDNYVKGDKGNPAEGHRYVSVVTFNTDATRLYDWVDVSIPSNLTAVKNAIDRLSPPSSGNEQAGTNFEGAMRLSGNQLEYATGTVATAVKALPKTNKWTVVLSDGAPTIRIHNNQKTSKSLTSIGSDKRAYGKNTNVEDIDDINTFTDRILTMSDMYIIGITSDVNNHKLVDSSDTDWSSVKPTVNKSTTLLHSWFLMT